VRYRWLVLLLAGLAQAQDVELQISLISPVGTETSRKGDAVSAKVLSPAGFEGAIVEGKVTESTPGAKGDGQSVLVIDFDMLRQGGAVTPINTAIKSAANSKGKANVDEDGRVIGARKARGSSASAASSLGRALGGIPGARRTGNTVSNAANSAGALAAALDSMAVSAPNLRFGAGSTFVISASTRSGPALATLAGAGAAAAATPAPQPVAQTAAQPAPQPAAQAPAGSGSSQPDLTVLKATFIPGDKTLFYDDFTDMGPDDAPAHFKVRGAAPQLKAGAGFRQLTAAQKGSLIPNLTSLPQNFTWESEIKADVPQGRASFNLILSSKGKQILHWILYAQNKQLDVTVSLRAPYQELGRKRIALNTDEPIQLALWLQNGRMRTFVNGEKQLDFNQVDIPAIDNIEIANDFLGAGPALGFRMMRFAESTPDFSQVISSSGRYVTHGILFDTDSDKLKPESAPVIQTIARGLENNPNLRLLIEGHTDSVGNADHNLDLSKRRAEALKTVLVSQFKVDAGRLTTAGLGATKPLDSNDTPMGRSQNRRVELVKQ
jgi:OmpA-OmpF porin, OOP family